MIASIRLLLAGILCQFIMGCTGLPDGIEPVETLDLEDYQGVWFEVARLNHSFEEGLSNVTATYRIQQDGSVRVINRGYSDSEGKWEEAIGRAVSIGEDETGHLKVSFFGPFYASYVVFYLSSDRQEAYITGFNRDYLWFLSRTPDVSDQQISRFKAYAREQGFNLEDLIIVDQSRNADSVSRPD